MSVSAAEFIPVAGDGGKEKPFVLGRTKSPAEQARENNAQQMPKVRREVNQLRLVVGAKWLFFTISDDSFMEIFGGDGYGTVCTTIKDLSKFYKHDRESVSKWLEILRDEGLVWTESERGYLLIHISAFVPPPALRASLVARAKARASNRVASSDTANFFAKNGHSTRKVESAEPENRQNPQPVGHPSTRKAGSTDTPCGILPQKVTAESARRVASTDTACGILPHGERVLPTTREASFRNGGSKSSISTASISSQEMSPSKEIGDQEEKGGKNPAPDSSEEAAFKGWERRLDDMRNSDLRKVEDIVKREFQSAKGDPAKEMAKRKLVAIRMRLNGPSVPDEPSTKPKPGPARKAPEQKPLTESEILESARSAQELGAKTLTKAQREALAAVGELA